MNNWNYIMPVYLLIILIGIYILIRLQGFIVALAILIPISIIIYVFMSNSKDSFPKKNLKPEDFKRYQNYFIAGWLGFLFLIILLSV